MGVSLKLVNHEHDFVSSATASAIVLNDLDDSSEEQRSQINRTIYTIQGDVFSNIPSCECGETTDAYNLGVKCGQCGTIVRRKIEAKLEPLVWIRAPNNVRPFMNPKFWQMLTEWFSKSGFSVLHYLTDPRYEGHGKTNDQNKSRIVTDLQNRDITGRGWNYFHDNFDKIVEALFTLASVRKAGKKQADYEPLYQLIKKERNSVFTQYLPMPNKALLVIEESDGRKKREKNIDLVINAMRLMTGIDVETKITTQKSREVRVVRVLDYLSDFYKDFDKANAAKEGIWRKHVMGTRSHFASRCVISSLTGDHQYFELHFPWGAAVAMLRYHILNKLERKTNWNSLKAINFLNKHALEYHPLLDEIMQELIKETPYEGIPVIHTRNPVLGYGSTQLMFITKVKTDVEDNTVGTSILAVVPWNLDFKL